MNKIIFLLIFLLTACINANASTGTCIDTNTYDNTTVNDDTVNANKVYILRGNFEGRNFILPQHIYHYDKYFFHQVSLSDHDNIVSSEPIFAAIEECLGYTARCMTAEVNSNEELTEFLKTHNEPVYVLNATVVDMNLKEELPTERDKISMDIQVEFSLQDARTGAVATDFITHLRAYDNDDVPTYAHAVRNSLTEVQRVVLGTLYQFFPVQGHITNLAKSKANRATAVNIDLGENQNLVKGVHFQVLKEGDPIARLEVTKVGKDTSKCKVLEGGEMLLDELNNGSKLQLKTYVSFWR